MASSEQLLEQCLQELVRTGDLEASLQHCPEYADEFRPWLEMAQMTRSYYESVPEAPGGLEAGRERMLAAAVQQREHGTTATPGGRTAAWRRLPSVWALRFAALMLAVVLGTAMLGSGLVWAASGSLPGDVLYPVKMKTEDVRLALAAGPGDKVALALGFVEERAEEMQALVEAGRPVPDSAVIRMERHLEDALISAAEADDEQMEGLLLQIARRTQVQAQRLEKVRANASPQGPLALEHAIAVCRRGAQAAEDGLGAPATFRWRYRHGEAGPEPTAEPEQDDERHQQRNQEQEQERERTPTGTPSVPPQRQTVTDTPLATPQAPRATAAPQGPKATRTPQESWATPEPTDVMPLGPRVTAKPQATPQAPQETIGPKGTPHHPEATAGLQVTPQGPAETDTPHATSQEPQATPGHSGGTPEPRPPGGGQGGGH